MALMIGKCKCPHPYASGGRRYVSYSQNGVIFELDIESGERKRICFGDEYFPIGNGRALLREGQDYIEMEEIR